MRKICCLLLLSALCACPVFAKSKPKKQVVAKAVEPPVPAKWDYKPMFLRGGQFRRYDGNPNWNPKTVHTSDSELGTPSYVSMPHYGPWVECEGRRVRVVTRLRNKAHFYRSRELPEANFFQNRPLYDLEDMQFVGLEDDKGTVLLPCVFERIVAVPGKGVFVRSYLKPGKWDAYSVATGRREARDGIADIQLLQKGADWHIYWEEAPDAYVITTHLPEKVNVRYQRTQILGTETSSSLDSVVADGIAPAPLASIEAYDGSGQLLAHYDRLVPTQFHPDAEKNLANWRTGLYGSSDWNCYNFYSGKVRQWRIVQPISPTGEICLQIVDAQWKPVGNPLPLALPAAPPVNLMIPAPVGQDLYWALTDDGKFAPWPGTVGFRPLDLNGYSHQSAWAVGYDTPEGLRFGWFNPETRETSGPIWRDVRRVQTQTLEAGEYSIGPTVAVQLLDGKWKTLNLNSRPGKPMPVFPIEFQKQEWTSMTNLLAEREKQSVNAVARTRRDIQMYDFWKSGKLPGNTDAEQREFAHARWDVALKADNERELRSIAFALGGNYLAQYIERDKEASIGRLENALSSATDTALRDRLKTRLDAKKKQAEEEAAARARAIEIQNLQFKIDGANSSNTGPNWNAWNNWTTARDSGPSYAEQSASTAARTQAMLRYTYGADNNPLLNPFKSWK